MDDYDPNDLSVRPGWLEWDDAYPEDVPLEAASDTPAPDTAIEGLPCPECGRNSKAHAFSCSRLEVLR